MSTSTENPAAKIASQGHAKVEQWFDELQKFEVDHQKRALEFIDEGARMMKSGLEYSIKMSEEWRKMTLQAQKQAVELWTAKWF